MSNHRLKIVYIVGSGRSGSTVLDRMLGTLDGVVSMNEIYRFFPDGIESNDKCTCGHHFHDCKFWRSICESVDRNENELLHAASLYERFDHTKSLPSTVFHAKLGQRMADFNAYLDWLKRLYNAIAEQSKSEILIDSSKVPSRLYLLSQIPEFDVYAIHLVRDVRAVVTAWRRTRLNPATGEQFTKIAPGRVVSNWIARNLIAELIGRKIPYYMQNYEGLMENPVGRMNDLVAAIDPLKGKAIPFDDEGRLDFQPFHSIGGNPDRFQSGMTSFRTDDRWQKELPVALRRKVSLLAYPLLRRYGYRIS